MTLAGTDAIAHAAMDASERRPYLIDFGVRSISHRVRW
ncbi:hypothetical protein LuPra_03829 [Luteitalea pratensis]|uniref:Uncharacterized protein n=1 Tax=Luteitalea pratensis TaxID=1855912 RepID=A0A143PPG0_LUTPR|nr:hypothetical protein LuPra_03825 [Luteitalea pratensis]AMY10589.1 hypothetical protein LuPra_03827 [Luteitalea pratensis]AMY10591.1 hypothetical protein LuPra_03829 [Luteitalea pratensis]